MPELPEVETIRSQLESKIQNFVIQKVEVNLPRLLLGISPNKFISQIQNQTIKKITRRGKYLIFQLNIDTIIFHLGMTGQMTVWQRLSPIKKIFKTTITKLPIAQGRHSVDRHTHLIFYFSKHTLLFRDVRTFGKIIFIKGKHWEKHTRIHKLGLEPLDLSWDNFKTQKLPTTSRRSLKALLLDQSFLAGIGNIYCDESLFLSKINPTTISSSLNERQWKNLLISIQTVLQKGIINSGTTFSDFLHTDGNYGNNQENLCVYGRSGKNCIQCQTILEKIILTQRTTVYCPQCQRI